MVTDRFHCRLENVLRLGKQSSLLQHRNFAPQRRQLGQSPSPCSEPFQFSLNLMVIHGSIPLFLEPNRNLLARLLSGCVHHGSFLQQFARHFEPLLQPFKKILHPRHFPIQWQSRSYISSSYCTATLWMVVIVNELVPGVPQKRHAESDGVTHFFWFVHVALLFLSLH